MQSWSGKWTEFVHHYSIPDTRPCCTCISSAFQMPLPTSHSDSLGTFQATGSDADEFTLNLFGAGFLDRSFSSELDAWMMEHRGQNQGEDFTYS